MAASPDPAQSVAPAPAPAPASAPAPAPAPAPASAQAPSQPQPQPQSSSFGRWFSGAADWCKGAVVTAGHAVADGSATVVKGVKGMIGYESLEVAKTTDKEEKEEWNQEQKASLWTRLSSLVGKDIVSLISLPVWVFEPTSFLQLVAEPLQFSELLDKVVASEDPHDKMSYLVAFTAAYYSQMVRSRKPFNPLLGETYEVIADDNSWRCFAEQVSHHPPVSVGKVDGNNWWMGLELGIKTKFWGNSMDCSIQGLNHFHDVKSNTTYTWGYITTVAHNLLIGSLWVDHFGDLIITSSAGDVAVAHYTKCGWLSAGRYEINAMITDAKKKPRMKVTGKWNESLYSVKLDDSEQPVGPPKLLWTCPVPNVHPIFKISKFVQHKLNGMTPELDAVLPPTDSRRRTDRRALELGDLEKAGAEKTRLEEKQRTEAKARTQSHEEWVPKHFKKTTDPVLGDTWELFSNYWQERETRLAEYKAKQAVPAPENPAPSSSTTSTVPPQPAPESAPAPAEPGKQ